MKNFMNNVKKARKNKKGFTLMEVIVVIAILAILAAIAVPSITGYIDEAEKQKYIAVARTAYTDAVFKASDEFTSVEVSQKIGTYSAGTDGDLGTADDVFTVGGTGLNEDGTYVNGSTVNLFAKGGPVVTIKTTP